MEAPRTQSDLPPRPEKASGMALASMILSLLGLLCTITAIVGLVLGIVELRRIRSGRSSEKDRGLATAGVIVGGLVVAVVILIIIVSLARGGLSFEFDTSS